MQHLRRPVLAAAALVAAAALPFPAMAATPGVFSLGLNLGTGIYSNSDINDVLEANDFEEITGGWEYGGSLRYQVSPKIGLDLEVNRIDPSSTTDIPGEPEVEFSTPAMAVPLNLVYELSSNDTNVFNLFGGPGILTGAKFRAEQDPDEEESDAGTAFYGQIGLEALWKLSPTFALGARALGRTASTEIDDPDNDLDGFEMNYGGIAFGLGARVFFGGGGE